MGTSGHCLAHHHDQAGVGHDQGVGLQRDDGLNVAQVGAHLVVVRQQVAGDKELFAALRALRQCPVPICSSLNSLLRARKE
jgi:hypothetical protein